MLLPEVYAVLLRQTLVIASTLPALPRAREINQYVPHHLRRDGVEMNPVFPVQVLEIGQPHVGFMHQGRGLERMITLLRHVVAGKAAQFGVNDRR
jgi:hypothetical protein